MEPKPHQPFFKRYGGLAAILVIVIMAASIFITQPINPAHAFTPAVLPPVTVASAVSNQQMSVYGGGCSYQGTMFGFYMDSSTGGVSVTTSTDGTTWTNVAGLVTMTNLPATGNSSISDWVINCKGNAVLFGWLDNSGGANNWHTRYEFCGLAGPVGTTAVLNCNGVIVGPVSTNGHQIHLMTSSSISSITYLNGVIFMGINNAGVGREFIENNIAVFNTTSIAAAGLNFGYTLDSITGGTSGGTFVAVAQPDNSHIEYMWSSNGVTWLGSPTVVAAANVGTVTFYSSSTNQIAATNLIGVNGVVDAFFVETNSGGNCPTGSGGCLEVDQISASGTNALSTIAGVAGVSVSPAATYDGSTNIVVIQGTTSNSATLVFSTNTGQTWSTFGFTTIGGLASIPFAASIGEYFSNQLGSFPIVSTTLRHPYNAYVQVVGITQATSPSQTTTIGSCPTKDTSVTTLANNTFYYYISRAPSPGTVINATAFVAAVTSVTLSQNLYVAIYAQTSTNPPQPVNVVNPLVFQTQKIFSIPSGSKNYKATYNPGVFIVAPGEYWAIGISGNSKININQTTVANQMYSVTAPGGVPPSSIISLTTTSGDLYMCGTMQFSFFTTVTNISTCTSTLGTNITRTVVGTSFVTSTATSLDANIAVTTTSGFFVDLLVILLPAMILMLGIGGLTHSAPGAGIGFAAGAFIGAGIGNFAGIIPFWLVAVLVIAIVFMLVGLFKYAGAQ